MKKSETQNSMPLELPGEARSLLLHSCCAPCAGGILENLVGAGITVTLYFHNPNIHPRDEYYRRKQEQQAFATKLGVTFVEADYAPSAWFDTVAGLEQEPERGARCSTCFRLRLDATAKFAAHHGFDVFATTLGISRWKDLEQVNRAGLEAAQTYPGVTFWPFNWRKGGGSQRMVAVSQREGFYHQQYCGCVFGLRDTNRWHEQKGQELILRDMTEFETFLNK